MPDDAPERPPRAEWISLAKAAEMFDPPRSRKALDQLHRRGVLEAWEEDGRLYTTVDAVRAYAFNSPRPSRLKQDEPLRQAMSLEPGVGRAVALQALVHELSAENAALRLRVIELEQELAAR